MHMVAKVSSKSQITLPSALRKATGIKPGDRVSIDLDDDGHITMSRVPSLMELAGSVKVPADIAGLSFVEVRELAYKRTYEQGDW